MVQIYENFVVISPCCLQHVLALTTGHSVDPDLHGPHDNTVTQQGDAFRQFFHRVQS